VFSSDSSYLILSDLNVAHMCAVQYCTVLYCTVLYCTVQLIDV
jgi:hypothetical protein